jgi:hypothetical protein
MSNAGMIGGVKEEEISALWSAEGEPPGEAGASSVARFSRQVTRLIAKRITREENGEFAVFLMSDSVQLEGSRLDGAHMPLLENGNDVISGSVWLTSPMVKDAYRLKLAPVDQTVLFGEIVKIGLTDLPAIVVDWRNGPPIATVYIKGIAKPDDKDQLVIEDRPITDDEMKYALDRFYETSLRTPQVSVEGHALKIWNKASEGRPAERPEERIQGRAVDQLRAKFPLRELRAEPVTENGRADITMFAKVRSEGGHGSIRYDWVLELKALCDRTSTGKIVAGRKIRDAVKKGLDQLVLYCEDLNAARGALCCYDLRASDEGDDTCFKPIVAEAAKCKAHLWRWYLHRSMEGSRKARLAKRA